MAEAAAAEAEEEEEEGGEGKEKKGCEEEHYRLKVLWVVNCDVPTL